MNDNENIDRKRKLALYYWTSEIQKEKSGLLNKPPPPRVYHRGIAATGFRKYSVKIWNSYWNEWGRIKKKKKKKKNECGGTIGNSNKLMPNHQ